MQTTENSHCSQKINETQRLASLALPYPEESEAAPKQATRATGNNRSSGSVLEWVGAVGARAAAEVNVGLEQDMSWCFHMAALYVGDLHPDVTEAMLYEKFSTIGPVLSLRVCRDAISRRSLGYAYVNYQQPGDAESALDTMNFDLIKGKPIRIMWSQRDPSLRKSGVGNLFIKNLDRNIDNKSMYDTFSAFGNILSCKVMMDEDGLSKGYGFIHFETAEAAKRAIEKVNGMLLNQKKVYVGQFIPHKERTKTQTVKPKMFTNVYVKNMPAMTETKLFELFCTHGKITSCAVMRNADGSSKGFGFVAYDNPTSAECAVEALHDADVDGQKIYVAKAQKKAVRQLELKRRFDNVKSERFQRSQGVNLFLKNLEDSVDDARLRKEFSQYGTITSVKVMMDEGRSKGFGFVCFSSPEEATKALMDMHGKMLGAKPIYVALAQRKEDRKAFIASHLQRIRIQPNLYPTPPPFIVPAIAQHRFYNVNHVRSTPRWMANPMRPNGTYPTLPNNMVRVNARASAQSLANSHRSTSALGTGRAIMGGGVPPAPPPPPPPTAIHQIHARGPSKYATAAAVAAITSVTANERIFNPITLALGNGGDIGQLNTSALAAASPEDQKQILGAKLYPLVEKLHPEHAGKITGMLLEIEPSEVLRMIEDRDSLRAKIEEAINVLQAHQQQENNTQKKIAVGHE